MPTTRRKQGATRNQSTLSFNNKSARVTKPTTHEQTAKKAQSEQSEPIEIEQVTDQSTITASEPEPTTTILDETKPEEVSIPVRTPQPTPQKKKAVKQSKPPTVDPREAAAAKVSDAQLKKYWKAEEDARLAPRGKKHPPQITHLLLPLEPPIFHVSPSLIQ
jgi:DNA polymerase delta subunit 4